MATPQMVPGNKHPVDCSVFPNVLSALPVEPGELSTASPIANCAELIDAADVVENVNNC
jgi:hypothetical protein